MITNPGSFQSFAEVLCECLPCSVFLLRTFKKKLDLDTEAEGVIVGQVHGVVSRYTVGVSILGTAILKHARIWDDRASRPKSQHTTVLYT